MRSNVTIQAIIWDVGGVLERTDDPTPRQNLVSRLGIDPIDLTRLLFGHSDNFRVQRGEITMEEHWANVSAQLDMTVEEIPAMLDEFFGGDRLDLDLVDYIRDLKHNYCTVILSNYMTNLRQRITEEWQIDDAFDYLIISSEVGLMKPDPEIYCLALETIGFEPEETVFVDDFIQNVEGARQVGIHGILFTHPEHVKTELNELIKN
jgi:epoxide hydrolase-like predicted phosphatase